MMKLDEIGTRARQAEPVLRIMETEKKNRVLKKAAENLVADAETIIAANALDMEHGKEKGMSQEQLAEQLGVSRNSVREAVRTLSLMGFVSSVQGAGNYISCDLEGNLSTSFEMMLLLGETNYLQVSQLRRGLESETARLAATRVLPGQLERLNSLAQRMAAEPDPEKGALLDQQFHMLLCEASGNLLLRALFRAMLATVNRFIGTMYVRIVSAEDQAKQLHDAHLEIVQALTEGDENAAIQGIWRHFQVVEEAILAMP